MTFVKNDDLLVSAKDAAVAFVQAKDGIVDPVAIALGYPLKDDMPVSTIHVGYNTKARQAMEEIWVKTTGKSLPEKIFMENSSKN